MVTQSFVRELQSLRQRPFVPGALDDRIEAIQGPTTDPDGAERFTTAIVPSPGDDLSIKLGGWTLRLIPVVAGVAKIPIAIIFEPDVGGNDGAFRELRLDILRFELIADPQDLVPARLVVDPYTHLERQGGVVTLLGPGATIILRGEQLDDFDVDFTGANGGVDARFPSARFSPPHFFLGGSDVGVACDEVLLDLKSDITPARVEALLGGPAPAFRGLLLEELGIFVGDPKEVGTWSGMARLKDFVINFDPVELTGTFEGELVRNTPPDNPQVAVEITWFSDSGQRLSVDEVDPTIPAPVAPETTRRVRLVATPNWASAGFEVTWTVPETAEVENPERRNQPDLGWVRVPPGATQFDVEVKDHRIEPPVTAHRTVLVQQPAAPGPGTAGLKLELTADVPEPAGGANAVHLFLPLRPGEEITFRAQLSDGTGATANLTFAIPGDWTFLENGTVQQANRGADGKFPERHWRVRVGNTVGDGAIGVIADLGTDTVHKRIRYTIRTPAAAGTPELELLTYADWLSQDGLGTALAFAHDGLAYDAVNWTMASMAAPAELFSDPTNDALFTAAATGFGVEAPLTAGVVGGLLKVPLSGTGQFFRVTGTVAPGAAVRPPSVVVAPAALRHKAPMTVPEVTALFAEDGGFNFYQPGGGDAGLIGFAWDRSEVPPSSPVHPEHEDPPLDQLRTIQATGIADLFHALLDHAGRIEKIGLFASASVEGPADHNQELSEARLASAKAALASPSSELRQLISALAAPHALTDAEITNAASIFAALTVETKAWGENNPTTLGLPLDRRVFAVLKLAVPAATAGFSRQAYFLVQPGAPIAPQPDRIQFPKPEQHPFHHSIFRSAHVEVELLRNDLVRLQIRLEIDIEKFDENDLDPTGGLNPGDGIVTGFLELRRNPDPAASPRYSWELDLLSSPQDVDGMAAFVSGGTGGGLVPVLGGPSITLPGFAAVSGGRTGPGGLILAIGIGVFMQQAGFFEVERMIWRGLRLKLQHGGTNATRYSVALDYSVKYMIDVDLFSIGIPVRLQSSRPLEISFRNVGVEILNNETVELFYDPSSGFKLDINDPGVFQLGDGIGRLLRVDRTTLGFGSPLFLEVELGFALDVGIFTIDTIRIRLSLEADKLFRADANGVVHLDGSDLDISDVSITINKLGVGVSVPGVLSGRGELGISDDGAGGTTVEGELELSFDSVPVLRSIFAALKLYMRDDLKALYLALGVEFVPGLPLGNTGVAIYGFHGLLGVNMKRSILEPLAWLKTPPVGVTDTNKWEPARGNWTFGVGATLGTVFDAGFAIHLKGTLLLEIPGPRFILAAQVEIFEILPDPQAPPVGILATVMLDLENDLLTVGIDYTLKLVDFIELHVPTEAFFNLADPLDFHLRFGEWEPKEKRAGIRIFDLFNAWGYLQIEGNGLDNGALGPLFGICVGAGARIEILWGRKGILYLEAFAEAHAGIQLAPLYFEGIIIIGGELHVGPISIGARGKLTAKVMVSAPRFLSLRGEACGYIDLWFTTLEKCVNFKLGDGNPPTPDPLNPFGDAVAIDRMTAQAIDTVNGAGETVIPIDALFHLAFTSDVSDGRPDPGISLVTDPATLLNQVSGDLYYRFTLATLSLRKVGGGVLTGIQSAWAPYSLISGPPAAADSQRTLRVLDWMPTAHPRQLDFGTTTASTLSQLIARLCGTREPPERHCADFDEEPLGHKTRWRLDQRKLKPVNVINSRANSLGTEAATSGSLFLPARVVPLVQVSYPDLSPKAHCLDLGRPSAKFRRPVSELVDQLGLSEDPAALGKLAQAYIDASVKVIHGEELPPELQALRGAGVIVVAVPRLVTLEATFVVPRELVGGDDGEVLLVNRELDKLAGPFGLSSLPDVPGSSTSGSVSGHIVRRLTWVDPEAAAGGDKPQSARWLLIRPPAPNELPKGRNFSSYLTQVCGITLADWQRFHDHEHNVELTITELQTLSGLVAGQPGVLSQPLLQPGAAYELSGSLHWERFRTDAADEVDGDGNLPVNSNSFRRFRADPNPPTDITRYVRDHDPVGEDQPHYFAEPMVLRFATGTIDALFAAYGRQLVVRAKADHTGHVVAQPMAAIAGTEFVPIGPAETEIVAALDALKDKCLPGAWEQLFPKTFARIDTPLAPNTGYTVSVLPRPLSEPGPLTFPAWDEVLQQAYDAGQSVYRFDLRTSRWAGFVPHVAAYRAAPVGDLFIDRPADLDTLLAGLVGPGPLRSDEVVDGISQLAFGGPLTIPDEPEVMRLWVPDGAGWRCRGVLLDGPEPLLRHRRDSSGATVERVGIEARWTGNVAVPFSLGSAFASFQVVAGARGARVFAFFTPPPTVQPGAVVLKLSDFGTEFAPAGTETLALLLGAVPQVLNEEAA